MNVRAVKAGLVVAEVPSKEHERLHGVSKLHPIRDGLRVCERSWASDSGPPRQAGGPGAIREELAEDDRLSELSAALQHPSEGGPSISVVS